MVPPRDRIERIVDLVFGTSINSIQRSDSGYSSDTYLIDIDKDPGRIICKIGGPSIHTGEVIEPLVVDELADTPDIPVPAVHATGRFSGEQPPNNRWALYEFCAGDRPVEFADCSLATRRQVLKDVGAMLGALHKEFQYDTFGAFVRSNEGIALDSSTGLDFERLGRGLLHRLPSTERNDAQPVLAHGDLYPGNLLINDHGEITTIFDWANSYTSTPAAAIARAELRFIDWFRFPSDERDRLQMALQQGYQQHRPIPREYHTVGWEYKVMWFMQIGSWTLRNLRTPHGRRQLRRTIGID